MSTSPHPDSHAWRTALDADAERLGLSLDATSRARFARYLELLLEWNERAGLTAVDDPETIARRHFGESLALLVALRHGGQLTPGVEARMADLGPGGGFPGVPMAIVEPSIDLVLIEAQERRCGFLRALVEALALPQVSVVHARAEEAGRDPALRTTCDLVVARALAPLPVLVEYALPLLRDGGTLAAPKGSRAAEELVAAQRAIAALGGEVLVALPLPLAADVPPQQVILVRRSGTLDARFPRRPGMPAKRPL